MFCSQHATLRKLAQDDAKDLLRLRQKNKSFLQPYEPIQSYSHYTLEAQREIVEQLIYNWDHGLGYGFGIFLTEANQLIGRVNRRLVIEKA